MGTNGRCRGASFLLLGKSSILPLSLCENWVTTHEISDIHLIWHPCVAWAQHTWPYLDLSGDSHLVVDRTLYSYLPQTVIDGLVWPDCWFLSLSTASCRNPADHHKKKENSRLLVMYLSLCKSREKQTFSWTEIAQVISFT